MKERLEQRKQEMIARAEQALLEQLPVDEKTLKKMGKHLEPRRVKRLLLVAVGGGALLSALGTAAHDRLARAAMARELKKQLAPIHEKLDVLQAQNEELKRQNAALRRSLEERESRQD